MPTDAESLKWVEVADFSPGIYGPRGVYLDAQGTTQQGQQVGAPLGAASLWHAARDTSTPTAPVDVPGTFRCVSVPGKGLVGAPRHLTANDIPLNPTTDTPGTFPPSENGRAIINATHLVSPIIKGDDVNTVLWENPIPPNYADELFVGFSRFVDPSSGTTWSCRVDTYAYKLWLNGAGSTFFNFYSGPGEVVPTRLDGSTWAAPFWYPIIDFTQLVDVIEVLTTVFYFNRVYSLFNMPQSIYRSTHVAQRIVGFPDPTTGPELDAIADVHGNPQTDYFKPTLIFAHEGRLCAIDIDFQGQAIFGDSAIIDGADDIAYWPIRAADHDVPVFLQKPIEENQSGIRVAQSINANELFLVKAAGGGAIISGDLDFPTVRRLPGIHSTGDVYVKAINTPLGIAYAGRGGIYLWNGAETSNCISQQFDGPFWSPYKGVYSAYTPTAHRWGFEGQLGYLYPWVLAPSFFMYDTRFNSWWLLDKPNTVMPSFSAHGTSQGHIIEVFPEVNATQHVLAKRYDPESQASSYSWTSQPITPERFRTAEVREVNIMATAFGTHTPQLTVTMLGLPDDAGVDTIETHTIDLVPNQFPTMYRIQMAVRCQSFVLSLDVDSQDASTPAPIIHSFRIGYMPLAETPYSQDSA